MFIAVWTDSDETQTACSSEGQPWTQGEATSPLPAASVPPVHPELLPLKEAPAAPESTPAAAPPVPLWREGWPIPSTISSSPEEARACIHLPEFDELVLEKVRVISGQFPAAEAEHRSVRGKNQGDPELEIPHFEKV